MQCRGGLYQQCRMVSSCTRLCATCATPAPPRMCSAPATAPRPCNTLPKTPLAAADVKEIAPRRLCGTHAPCLSWGTRRLHLQGHIQRCRLPPLNRTISSGRLRGTPTSLAGVSKGCQGVLTCPSAPAPAAAAAAAPARARPSRGRASSDCCSTASSPAPRS